MQKSTTKSTLMAVVIIVLDLNSMRYRVYVVKMRNNKLNNEEVVNKSH